jgi:nucleoid-associated protein YgaU
MGNKYGVKGTEVKVGVGLIGVLLAILAVVIIQRSNRQPAPADVAIGGREVVGGGEVIPAEFHARAPAPTVLKPRASLPPPTYADQASPAELREGVASRSRSEDALTMASDAAVPRNFMPKLPTTPSPEEPPSTRLPPGDDSPRYPPVVMPRSDGPQPPGFEPRAAQESALAIPPAIDDPQVHDVEPFAGRPAAEAAEAPLPVTPPPLGEIRDPPQPETAIADPIAADAATPPQTDRPNRDADDAIAPPPVTSSPSEQTNSLAEQKSGPGEGNTYTAKARDSMWSISKKAYGTGTFFRALTEHNRDRIPTPELLAVGDQVLTPAEDLLREKYPNLCPRLNKGPTTRRQVVTVGSRTAAEGGRRYLVEEGDTLGEIARYELGDASRWTEVYQLNRALLGNDPHSIRLGMWLVLPTSSNSTPLAQRPTEQRYR